MTIAVLIPYIRMSSRNYGGPFPFVTQKRSAANNNKRGQGGPAKEGG